MRNELFVRVIEFIKSKTAHRYCEDGFYACPKNEDYFGLYSRVPIEKRECNCGAEEAVKLLKDFEAGWQARGAAEREAALEEVYKAVSKAVCTNIGLPYDEGAAAALAAIRALIAPAAKEPK